MAIYNGGLSIIDLRQTENSWAQKQTISAAGAVTSGSTSGALTVSTGGIYAKSGIKSDTGVYNAVWNDLADCIPVDDKCKVEPGYCYCFDGEKYYKATKYLDEGIVGIDSDTYGMNMGHKPGLSQMDVAVAGFVLAYVDKEYKPGTPLAVKSRGRLTKAGLFRRIFNKKSIVGYFDRKETNDLYVSTHVNGRSWIKVI